MILKELFAGNRVARNTRCLLLPPYLIDTYEYNVKYIECVPMHLPLIKGKAINAPDFDLGRIAIPVNFKIYRAIQYLLLYRYENEK